MPELIAKRVRIKFPYVHFHSVIAATIGPGQGALKLPGKYRDDQAERLWEKECARFTPCQ